MAVNDKNTDCGLLADQIETMDGEAVLDHKSTRSSKMVVGGVDSAGWNQQRLARKEKSKDGRKERRLEELKRLSGSDFSTEHSVSETGFFL